MVDPLDPFERLKALLALRQISAKNGTVGVILKPYQVKTFTDGRSVGYRLYMEAIDPCGMPAEIFVYQRKPIVWDNLPYKDDFQNVASLADLEEYAVGAPADSTRPFFRLSFVDLIFRNMSLLTDAIVGIYSDTTELVWAIEANATLETLEDLPVGSCPAWYPSSSLSSSSSI